MHMLPNSVRLDNVGLKRCELGMTSVGIYLPSQITRPLCIFLPTPTGETLNTHYLVSCKHGQNFCCVGISFRFSCSQGNSHAWELILATHFLLAREVENLNSPPSPPPRTHCSPRLVRWQSMPIAIRSHYHRLRKFFSPTHHSRMFWPTPELLEPSKLSFLVST